MSKLDMENAIKMRERGATYQEIAEKYGVTKQYVHNSMKRGYATGRIRRKDAEIFEASAYVGILEWYNRDHFSMKKLYRIVYGDAVTRSNQQKLIRLIEGDNITITMKQLNNILRASGMTYEHFFERRTE